MDIPITQAKTTGQIVCSLNRKQKQMWERKTNIFVGYGLGIVPYIQIRKYEYIFMVGKQEYYQVAVSLRKKHFECENPVLVRV